MADSWEKVQLYVYDLSNGLARQMSMALIGKQLEGVWHTAVVVGGREYYYGQGIQEAPAGCSPFGNPLQVVDLGHTQLPKDMQQEFLEEQKGIFTPAAYSLFDNNCNNFSDTFAQFLTGNGIPSHITALPREVLATPFGQMIAPMLTRTVGQTLGNMHQPAPGQPAAPVNPLASSGPPSGTPSRPSASAAAPRPAAPSGVSTAPAGPPSQGARAGPSSTPAAASSAAAGSGGTGPHSSGAGGKQQPVGQSPVSDITAAEIKQALAFTAADTGVPIEASRASPAPAPSADEQQGFRELSAASAELHKNPCAASSLSQAGSAPLGSDAQPRGSSEQLPAGGPSRPPAGVPSDGQPGLQDRVRKEFERLMAQGGLSANEAGVQALQNAMRKGPS